MRCVVLHAGVAAPNRRNLRRQQIIRRLRHPCANSVEPFLTRGLAQDGLLVIVDFAQAYPARVDGLGRGGRSPSVQDFIIGQSSGSASLIRRLTGVNDAVEFSRSPVLSLHLQLWRVVLRIVLFTVLTLLAWQGVLRGVFAHGFTRVRFRRWRAGLGEVILLLREVRAHIPSWISLRTETRSAYRTPALVEIFKWDLIDML